ncbi:MAG TPA: beta-propeller fold lactonase family protein [Acidobacteriaceae bacterium]|jgi:YVTN family beta-propeller protein|nr:beta-propeller fold lactonase family protein [Acidobacteriaceae bacterium]
MSRRASLIVGSAALMAAAALWQPRIVTGAAHPSLDQTEPYASPVELLLSPDGSRLYVLCEGTGDMRVLDTESGQTIRTLSVGRDPRGFSFSPDGSRLFVANSWDDTVTVIDTNTYLAIATWAAGFEPSSVIEDRAGRRLFIADRIGNNITVLDAATGVEQETLEAGRGASYLAMTTDGRRLYATHVYPNPTPYRTPPSSEITVIDPNRAQVVDRIPLPSVAGVFHVALSRDGRLGVVGELHPKNLVPLAHVEHGWGFVDSLTVFGVDVGKPVELPLDELDRYYARPFGVAIAPDKSRIYVSHGGSDCVSVINVSRMLAYIRMHPQPFAEDLSASAHYVVARIPVGKNPRGILLSGDGARLYVANRLDDTISVINTRTLQVTQTIRLAGPRTVSALRHGEQTFYSAKYAFQGQFGCANCHIDSTFDGLQWDLEPDGFGQDIVDNRLIEDLRGTDPFKWNGGNPTLAQECGIRTEMYFWRSQNYSDLTLTDLVLYLRSLPSRPNRWRAANGELTPAQERGSAVFHRATDKLGQPIPPGNQCATCHSGSKGTSQKSFDVGTKKPTDTGGLFDTPQLTNIALTAPYLHDGSAATLEEIWTIYNPHDRHGRTNDLTKDELNDLIEYLRTR